MSNEVGTLSSQQLTELLQSIRSRLPASPAVKEIRWREMLDSTDQASLDVFIALADDTPEAQMSWRCMQPIEDAILETLQREGERRWPYFTIGKESDVHQWFAGNGDGEE